MRRFVDENVPKIARPQGRRGLRLVDPLDESPSVSLARIARIADEREEEGERQQPWSARCSLRHKGALHEAALNKQANKQHGDWCGGGVAPTLRVPQ